MYDQFRNMVLPVTTNAFVSSSEQPSFVIGFGAQAQADGLINGNPPRLPLPAYNLGMNYRQAATQAASDFLIAFNLPQKLSFPYLVCYSNIQTPCGLQYQGSANGQQLLSAIAYLSTNYTVSDFAYSFRSDLVFTVKAPFVITEILTEIHFPSGELAESVLGDNSGVIYRIDFAQRPDVERPLAKDDAKHRKDI